MCRVVAYYRVSTDKQGRSGLGLEAQRQSVLTLCQSRGWEVIEERTEIESGKVADRPELNAALHLAKVTGATLVVAKLDRLSRSVAFLSALQDSGAKFVAADMPEANELTVHIMAAVAQAEREAISKRTKDALRAAKAAGRKLGNPNGAAALRRAGKGNKAAVETVKAGADVYASDLAPVVSDIQANGAVTLAGIAAELNARHILTRRGGCWHASSVKNLLARLHSPEVV
ncbi:recombinase family protein [Erythrobacter sp. Alg231-14]|uniref:recombinase family protein n=1 Tax=Erythrobacter sp. Alg231-14 TaxID=1922225 RepID=UPI000D55F25B